MAVKYRLVPVSGRLRDKGGYRAVIDNGDISVDTDLVLREVCERFGGRTTPEMLKMYVSAVLDTMIEHTAADGRRRRFGDYFTIRLDVRGRFEGEDAKLDGSQQVVFNIQPRARFKAAAVLPPALPLQTPR